MFSPLDPGPGGLPWFVTIEELGKPGRGPQRPATGCYIFAIASAALGAVLLTVFGLYR